MLSLDVTDISGEQQRDVSHNILKTHLDPQGVPIPNTHSSELGSEFDRQNAPKPNGYCGSCYGADPPEGGCCNTCDSVRQAYVNRGWSFTNPDGIEQVSASREFSTCGLMSVSA